METGKIKKTGIRPVTNYGPTSKSMIKEGVEKYIPHKTAGTKNSLPWITPEIRKLLRKDEKIYRILH